MSTNSTGGLKHAIFLRPDEGERLKVITDDVRVLIDGRATGNGVFMMVETAIAGNGPPLHRHAREDEYFFVLAGAFKFVCDGREFVAEQGAFVAAPHGSTHTFSALGPAGSESKLLVVCTPSGLEVPFRVAHEGGASMPMDKLLGAFAAAGVEIVGPPLGAG
jgi:mannose-6-phosphate isomerase-like protein (cupin superfamily)